MWEEGGKRKLLAKNELIQAIVLLKGNRRAFGPDYLS